MPEASQAATAFSASSIIGLAALAGAIALGLVLFLLARRRGRPALCYAVRGIEIVSPHIAHFGEVRLVGRAAPVATLTLSEILVWNASGRPVDAATLTAARPIAITAPAAAEIYGLNLIRSDLADARVIEADGAPPALDFATLPPHRGFVVQVLHGGADLAAVRIGDQAAPKPMPARRPPPYTPWQPRQVRTFLFLGAVVVLLLLSRAHVLHPLYLVCLVILLLLFGGGPTTAAVAWLERHRLGRLSPALRYFCDRDTITLPRAASAGR